MRSDNPNCIKATLLGHLRSLLVTVEKVADMLNTPLGIAEEIDKEYETLYKAEADTVEDSDDSTVEVEA